jgi:histidinol-phosphate/aromatic aminotransferase/cobyric acid decarboxylase-like protein
MDDSKNDALLKNKIYIRKFRSGVYRITIGKKEENDKLLEVLK